MLQPLEIEDEQPPGWTSGPRFTLVCTRERPQCEDLMASFGGFLRSLGKVVSENPPRSLTLSFGNADKAASAKQTIATINAQLDA
eukprot:ANDGO_04065.mRNA.1 hypothetical protein